MGNSCPSETQRLSRCRRSFKQPDIRPKRQNYVSCWSGGYKSKVKVSQAGFPVAVRAASPAIQSVPFCVRRGR